MYCIMVHIRIIAMYVYLHDISIRSVIAIVSPQVLSYPLAAELRTLPFLARTVVKNEMACHFWIQAQVVYGSLVYSVLKWYAHGLSAFWIIDLYRLWRTRPKLSALQISMQLDYPLGLVQLKTPNGLFPGYRFPAFVCGVPKRINPYDFFFCHNKSCGNSGDRPVGLPHPQRVVYRFTRRDFSSLHLVSRPTSIKMFL